MRGWLTLAQLLIWLASVTLTAHQRKGIENEVETRDTAEALKAAFDAVSKARAARAAVAGSVRDPGAPADKYLRSD